MAVLFMPAIGGRHAADGMALRKALNTANWELASEMVRVMETGGASTPTQVSEAVRKFLSNATARKLSEASLKKYRVLLQGRRSGVRASPTLEEDAEDKGCLLLKQLDTDVLRDFRKHWKDAPLAGRKKLERLAFFRFANEAGWVSSNPRRRLSRRSYTAIRPCRWMTTSRLRKKPFFRLGTFVA